jgi:hypothetical protein
MLGQGLDDMDESFVPDDSQAFDPFNVELFPSIPPTVNTSFSCDVSIVVFYFYVFIDHILSEHTFRYRSRTV